MTLGSFSHIIAELGTPVHLIDKEDYKYAYVNLYDKGWAEWTVKYLGLEMMLKDLIACLEKTSPQPKCIDYVIVDLNDVLYSYLARYEDDIDLEGPVTENLEID